MVDNRSDYIFIKKYYIKTLLVLVINCLSAFMWLIATNQLSITNIIITMCYIIIIILVSFCFHYYVIYTTRKKIRDKNKESYKRDFKLTVVVVSLIIIVLSVLEAVRNEKNIYYSLRALIPGVFILIGISVNYLYRINKKKFFESGKNEEAS